MHKHYTREEVRDVIPHGNEQLAQIAHLLVVRLKMRWRTERDIYFHLVTITIR